MHVRNQLRHRGVGVDQPLRHLARVRRGVTNALDTRDFGDVLDQYGEVGKLFRVSHRAAKRIDILAKQSHFLDALAGQASNFGQHIIKRPRNFTAARVGNNAESAKLGAAFHDGNESRRAFHFSRRHRVELFDFREGNIHRCLTLAFALGNQLRQTVQGLRPKNDIDVRRTGNDCIALLAGDAAANANNQVGV